MSKQSKILIILVFVALLLVVYLIISSKPVMINNAANSDNLKNETINQIDLAKLEEEYKKNVKDIFFDLEVLVKKFKDYKTATNTQDNIDSNEEILAAITNDLLKRLMDAKVPENYRELHFNLVLVLEKMEDYLNSDDLAVNWEEFDYIERAKSENSWLNIQL